MAREMALQMLYQSDLGGSGAPTLIGAFDLGLYRAETEADEEARASGDRAVSDAAFEYAQRLVNGTLEHREEIDELIRVQADNWRLERMPAVDRGILRLAVFELLHEEDVPKLVVVDEAVELAKKFGSEQSARFVNGLLDGLLKVHQFPGSMT
ncbi:MAG: transcription antitermination factor NusB [Thermoanaerobaculia bacterium]